MAQMNERNYVPAGVLGSNAVLTDAAIAAYNFILSTDKSHPQYTALRALHAQGFHDLWSYMYQCEEIVENIKGAVKDSMSYDEEHLPQGIKWKAATYQQKFNDSVAAAKALAAETGKDISEFTLQLSPTQAMKVAGVDLARLKEIVGEGNYVSFPQERALLVK